MPEDTHGGGIMGGAMVPEKIFGHFLLKRGRV